MRGARVARLSLLAVVGVLTGCGCEAVLVSADGKTADTVAIDKTNGNCTVLAYAADSVGPKPK